MHSIIKISSLFLIITIQFDDSFPQLSIPYVPWNRKDEEPSRFPVKVPNPFSSIFGKKINPKQYNKTPINNKIGNYNEKIITVTPHTVYYTNIFEKPRQVVQTTQNTMNNFKQNPTAQDPNENKSNVNNKNMEKKDKNENNGKWEDQIQKQYNFTEDDLKEIFNFETTTDTTESTTDYESTTEDLSSLNRYGGTSGHVVATLLGR